MTNHDGELLKGNYKKKFIKALSYVPLLVALGLLIFGLVNLVRVFNPPVETVSVVEPDKVSYKTSSKKPLPESSLKLMMYFDGFYSGQSRDDAIRNITSLKKSKRYYDVAVRENSSIRPDTIWISHGVTKGDIVVKAFWQVTFIDDRIDQVFQDTSFPDTPWYRELTKTGWDKSKAVFISDLGQPDRRIPVPGYSNGEQLMWDYDDGITFSAGLSGPVSLTKGLRKQIGSGK